MTHYDSYDFKEAAEDFRAGLCSAKDDVSTIVLACQDEKAHRISEASVNTSTRSCTRYLSLDGCRLQLIISERPAVASPSVRNLAL